MDPRTLSTALQLGPKTRIARTAKCAPRTIRRRQLDYGIHAPRPNCFLAHPLRINNTTIPPHQHPGYISDNELDWCLAIILQDFPTFGRRLALGALRKDGVRVSEVRVRASLQRIRGVAGRFQDRRIHRRRYKVPGANSLWHHDGQHGIHFFSLTSPYIMMLIRFCRLDPMENRYTWIH